MTAAMERDAHPSRTDRNLEARCVELYDSGNGLTMEQIGHRVGRSQQQVSEILSRARRASRPDGIAVRANGQRALLALMTGEGAAPESRADAGPFRGLCPHCGYRAASTAGHTRGKITGVPICLLPPELRKAEL